MGDRSNVYITSRNPQTLELETCLDIYSHWGGEAFHKDAQKALADAKPRWRDPSYGIAMFLQSLFRLGSVSGIHPYGFDDNENKVVEICWNLQRVYVWPQLHHANLTLLENAASMSFKTFEEFIS